MLTDTGGTDTKATLINLVIMHPDKFGEFFTTALLLDQDDAVHIYITPAVGVISVLV